MFIAKCCGCLTEDRILESVSSCAQHNQPYVFVCPRKQPSCRQKPLLCHTCLSEHKDHEFQQIQHFFTPEFKNILKSGTSLNGHAVRRMYDHVLSDIGKMRSKLNKLINKVESSLKYEIEKLLPKYPLGDKFGIPGTEINPENITMILDIVDRQKSHIWVPSTQKYIRSLLGQVTAMISNLIDDLDEHMINQPYQAFTEAESQRLINQFVQKYQGVFDPDKNHFSFSRNDKHDNIKVHEEGRIAKYVHNSPSYPGVLTTNPFTKSSSTVYLRMGKIEKTAIVFDATLIVVGVCVPNIVRIFGYRQLIQPAHGAYMIGSNGKSYHSTLEKYNKKPLAFSFGQDDTIAIRVDFTKKQVHFSKWGFFQRHFSMPLTVKDEQMAVLRPCVMFHGERGAIVQIVNERIYKRKDQDTHGQKA